MKKILSLLLVALMIVGMLPMMPITANAAAGNYVKVTSAPADWSGEYLIVYETGKVAFNGQLTKLDNANNNVTVTINDGKIEATDAMKAASFTIEKDGTGYNIKSASGYYIGNNSNSNALSTNTSTKYVSTITLESDGSVKIAGSAGAVLRYNANSGNYRFRYFKSSTYTSQKAICLYKLEESSGGETVCEHTNTVAIGEAKAATCTETGMTAGVKCADCGEVITAQKETPIIPHSYVDGICSVCKAKKPDGYELITLNDVPAGDYVIGAVYTGKYPTIYPATAKITTTSNKDWNVSGTAVNVTGDIITDDQLPADAQVFAFAGNNTDGFTISFNNGTETVYLGYTDINTTRRLAFGASYSNIKWTVVADPDGGFALRTTNGTNKYTISQNATTGTAIIRGYKGETIYTGIYLFAKEADTPEVPPCDHTDTTTTTVEAKCTTDGSVTVTCSCGYIVSTEVLPAIGHNYVDGFCANCSEPKPASLAGRYYIATIRKEGDNYFYMTSDLGTASTKRYQAVDSNLKELPESITDPEKDYVFVLVENTDGTYCIYAEGVEGDNYLGYSAVKSGLLVAEEKATHLTVAAKAEGAYNIYNGTEYLSLNNDSRYNYFAFYAGTQVNDLYLIPVVEGGSETPDEPETPVDPPVPETPDTPTEAPTGYVKVTEAPEDWTGVYVIVYVDENGKAYVFNGKDAVNGYVEATISNNAIAQSETVDAVQVIIKKMDGGYAIKTEDGYIYGVLDSNELKFNMTTQQLNTIAMDTEGSVLITSNTSVLRFNDTANQMRFRYYKASSYANQKAIYLYKLVGAEVETGVTAKDGANALKSNVQIVYDGFALPTTVTAEEVAMNVQWSIETTDANAAKIVDGKLVLAPQAAAATYTLTATVKNGETDTATATWEGTVVPASAEIADGTYVFWVDGKAVKGAFAVETYTYGYLPATDGITLTDGVLAGHANVNIFTLTANGDGTYTIQVNGGKYLYSDMSHASSRYFNLAAEKPASGADWTIVASGEGYYIYNVDRAGAIGYYSSENTFGLYTDTTKQSVMNVTAVDNCAHEKQTTTEYPASCLTAGSTVVTCDDCHMVLSETPIEATGHSYVEGICSACSDKDPYVFGTKYYIATFRGEGNYIYMTSNLGDADTKRYQAVDSNLPIPPVNIDPAAAQDECVFILMENEDGTYYILAYGVEGDNYLGWKSGNSGILVSKAAALKVTLTKQADGTSQITFVDGEDKTRYLALNARDEYQYFAWYTSEQCNDLSLIPVEETKEQVNQYGVVLNDGFLMKFNVSLTANAQIAITANGETVTYSADQLSAVVNGTYDVYVELAAAQMADVVTVKFITDGVAGEPKTYTIKEYAETILDGEYDDVTKQLVTDMLAYGAAAQTYFQYNDKNLVSDGTGAGTEAPKADKEMDVSGNTDGIRFYGASLVFENKIALRFYFQVGENVTFAIEEKYTVSQKNGLYCVEIADILPQDLKNDYTVTVTDGPIVTYSPMNYLVRMNEKGGESLQALVVALYNYHLAAVAYAQPAAQ